MILQGTVYDIDSSMPIPYASIIITTTSGTPTNAGVSANSQGQFYLNSALAEYPNYLTVSSSGYITASIQLYDDFNIDFTGDILLHKRIKDLPPVVLPPAHPDKKNNYAWLLLLGIPLLIKKRKVSGVQGNETLKTIGLGILLWKGIDIFQQLIDSLGLGGDHAANNAETDPGSPWQPDYWKKNADSNTASYLSSQYYTFKDTADQLWNNTFHVTYDDWEKVKGYFDSLSSKVEVSFLCDVFREQYSSSLLSFLRTGGGILPWDGLSSAHINILLTYVNNLPIK